MSDEPQPTSGHAIYQLVALHILIIISEQGTVHTNGSRCHKGVTKLPRRVKALHKKVEQAVVCCCWEKGIKG